MAKGFQKGQKFSEAHKAKLREKRKLTNPALGKHWKIKDTSRMNKDKIGKKRPPRNKEWSMKLGKIHIGKKPGNYIEDRTKLAKRQERNDSAYKEWRKNVRNRDGWKCKINNKDCTGKVVAHHILPWSIFPELRYKVKNGITLCRYHHPLTRKGEIELAPCFQSLVNKAN